MSIYHSSCTMPNPLYSSAILLATRENLPSVVLTTLALVTAVTLLQALFLAYSNASRIILSAPCSVITLKSMLKSSPTSTPRDPKTYAPSVFSLKNIQSIPSDGTLTGRTLAKRSSSLLIATFALSILGQLSPSCGVVVGPLRITWHFFISSRTSSGIAFPHLALFSIVRPSMSLNSTLPAATSSLSIYSSTRCACFDITFPIPSPQQIPTITGFRDL